MFKVVPGKSQITSLPNMERSWYFFEVKPVSKLVFLSIFYLVVEIMQHLKIL